MASVVKDRSKTGIFNILNVYKKTSRKGAKAQSCCTFDYRISFMIFVLKIIYLVKSKIYRTTTLRPLRLRAFA